MSKTTRVYFGALQYLLWAGATEEEPSTSAATGLCTTVEAAKAVATDGRTTSTLEQRYSSGRAGAWSGGPGRGSGALAHPRSERMSSSSLNAMDERSHLILMGAVPLLCCIQLPTLKCYWMPLLHQHST